MAVALFEQAFQGGDLVAGKRWLELLQDPGTPLYDPAAALELKGQLDALIGGL